MTGDLKGFMTVLGIVVSIVIAIIIAVPVIIFTGFIISNLRADRARERLLAQEDNIIRYGRDDYWQDYWSGIQDITIIDHEVDMNRYRPFSEGNNLIVIPEPPTIIFTENFPRLDGATAAFPVFAAMAQFLYYGLDEHTVMEYVIVSRTDIAYERLINGEIDIFFGAQPSEQQLQMARDDGVEFMMTPIAREAFVFFVHTDNPVYNLSVAEIQDIYQRNITNWSQVGGRDERILAFQRPENSGSQTIMQALVMEGRPLSEPVLEEEVGPMGAIIGYVAINNYRNVSSAIGYSFRYFATGMRPHDDIQIIAVDGVEPTIVNIQNRTYPFVINVYAVTAGSANENVAHLLNWILSDQGQRFIEHCGVVPIR